MIRQAARVVIHCAELAFAFAACVGCCGCGDPSTAKLPVNLDQLGPVAPEHPAQAVLVLRLGDASPAERCGLDAEVTLPTSGATGTLTSGVGERLMDGVDISVDCHVKPADIEGMGFDIDLRLEHRSLPRFQLTGTLRSEPLGSVVIDLALPDADPLRAECSTRVDEIRAGAVWIGSLTCPEPFRASERLTSCALSGGVIFENCASR
jgi:hypothetical protein